MCAKLKKTLGPFDTPQEMFEALLKLAPQLLTLPAKVNKILHFFYFDEKDDCLVARDEFQEIGLKIENMTFEPEEPSEQWLLVCSSGGPFDAETLFSQFVLFLFLAEKYNGTYDGFEVEVLTGETDNALN